MMRALSQSCPGGSNGVPPLNWVELQNHGDSVVRTLIDLRLELAKGQTSNARQQIIAVEGELETIIKRVHNNCSGGCCGVDPVNYGGLNKIKAAVKSELDEVKLLLGG
jgi:hypothetical protein